MHGKIALPKPPLLRKLESISVLSDAERRAIEATPVTIRVLQAGDEIIRDKERARHCCLLLHGWAYRYKVLPGGGRQILSLHVAGDMPDLLSLHLPVMDHNLSVLTTSTIGLIDHKDMNALATRFPNLAAALWRESLIDGGIFNQWMICLGRHSSIGRIAHLFCELYLRLKAVGLADDHCYVFPFKQVELADAKGITSIHVNRTLQTLRKEKLIKLYRGSLSITNWPGLVEVGEFNSEYLHLGRYVDDDMTR